MGRERFDSTFFQLIQLHIDITSKLTIKGGSAGIEALVAFDEKLRNSDHDFVAFQVLQKLSDDIVTRMKDTKSINPTICPDLTLSEIANIQERLNVGVSFIDNYMIERLEYHKLKVINAYTAVAAQNIDSFSHYFRNLYHILKFVDCAEFLSESEKKVYTNFLRSQLSDVELVCLFYNSIAVILLPGRNGMELGYPKMQVLLKKYNVLQNMNPRSVIHPLHFKVFEA
ncbi:MAG: hypothetical protein JWR22_2184 [Herminiimonas sp.]|nr:hypothetical protein [Herminiimonas sp.]